MPQSSTILTRNPTLPTFNVNYLCALRNLSAENRTSVTRKKEVHLLQPSNNALQFSARMRLDPKDYLSIGTAEYRVQAMKPRCLEENEERQ